MYISCLILLELFIFVIVIYGFKNYYIKIIILFINDITYCYDIFYCCIDYYI